MGKLQQTSGPAPRVVPLRRQVVRVRAERDLRSRLKFETFLSELSARFINIPVESVVSEIDNALRRLVEFLDVDRSSLVSGFGAADEPIVLSSYAVPGVPPLAKGARFADLGSLEWYVGELVAGRTVRLDSIDSLPASAVAERRYLTSVGIKSHVGIPIRVGNLPLCALGIASFREQRCYSDDFVARLRLVGEVFANALARRNSVLELKRLQSELSHVTRVSTVGHLAASIAHEINQPLCAILTNAQAALRLLAAPTPDLEDVRAALFDIAADDKRAGAVVARAHAMLKRQDLQQTSLSLNDVVNDAVLLLRSDALIRQITLKTDLDELIAAVEGDRIQLQQVVMNLILNGMDAIAQTSEGPRDITLSSRTGTDAVRVTVRDTGIGFTPKVAANMFDPFFTTKKHGLGMGLAINRKIVQAHRGTIWASNCKPRGATVEFELPVAGRRAAR